MRIQSSGYVDIVSWGREIRDVCAGGYLSVCACMCARVLEGVGVGSVMYSH